jgi:hypothetical protein
MCPTVGLPISLWQDCNTVETVFLFPEWILKLFSYVVSVDDVIEGGMRVDIKNISKWGLRRSHHWPVLKHCTSILLEWLRSSTENIMIVSNWADIWTRYLLDTRLEHYCKTSTICHEYALILETSTNFYQNKHRGLSPQANYTDRLTPPLVGEVSANFCG